MPVRSVPLVTNQIYHTFNQGLDRRVTYRTIREFRRAMLTIWYYRYATPPVKLSHFLSLSLDDQHNLGKELRKQEVIIDVLCFCLMKNHFHLLLKQEVDEGISRFLSQFQNSYTRYFNIRHKRKGALFLERFKAVRIETDEQLLHVSRYIHLNPYSGFVVKALSDLKNYPWSSLLEYLGNPQKTESICKRSIILNHFRTPSDYRKFVFDQADYQRKLEQIKHLTFEREGT